MLGSYKIRTDLAVEARERFTEENVEVRGVEVREDCVGLGSVHTAVGLGQVVGLVEVGVIGIALIRQLRFAGHRTQRHTKIGPVV